MSSLSKEKMINQMLLLLSFIRLLFRNIEVPVLCYQKQRTSSSVNFSANTKMFRFCGVIAIFIVAIMTVDVRATSHYEIVCSDSGPSEMETFIQEAKMLLDPDISPDIIEKIKKPLSPIERLEILVNAKLKNGWKLQGGVSILSYTVGRVTHKLEVDFKYCQALFKPE